MPRTPIARAINANTYRTLRNDGNAVILFYKEWCPYCRDFMPKWNRVAQLLAANLPVNDVKIAKVNVERYPYVVQEERISTVPHIKFFKRGSKPVEYTFSREPTNVFEAIVDYYARDVWPPQETATASKKFNDSKEFRPKRYAKNIIEPKLRRDIREAKHGEANHVIRPQQQMKRDAQNPTLLLDLPNNNRYKNSLQNSLRKAESRIPRTEFVQILKKALEEKKGI